MNKTNASSAVQGTSHSKKTYSATNQSSDFTNTASRGLHLMINVTTAGTGTIQPVIVSKESISSTYIKLTPEAHQPLAWMQIPNTVGLYLFTLYPGINLNGQFFGADLYGAVSQVLPPSFAVNVIHSDNSDWTYSISYTLLS